MAISQKQAEQFFKWVTTHGNDQLRCEVCQNNSFGADMIAVIPQQVDGDMVSIDTFNLSRPLARLVTATCHRCGCTKFFDATRVGLVDEEQGTQSPRFGA